MRLNLLVSLQQFPVYETEVLKAVLLPDGQHQNWRSKILKKKKKKKKEEEDIEKEAKLKSF
jgi:hypothetical protein